MSTIPLATFTQSVKADLESIYSAISRHEFDLAFDRLVAVNAKATLNGKAISREQYKDHFFGTLLPGHSTNVDFKGTVESFDGSDESSAKEGEVGLFYETHAGAQHPTYNVSLNVTVHRKEGNAPVIPRPIVTQVIALNEVSRKFPAIALNRQE